MTYETFWLYFRPALEITILWIVVYQVLVFLEGTRAFLVMRGLSYLAFIFLLTKFLALHNINWILTKIFGISVIALIIIFQNELRQGLARLGQQQLFSSSSQKEALNVIEHLAEAVFKLSKKKSGALIAIEKNDKLSTFIESGLSIDAKISAELLQNIFIPKSPLHDGGVIVRGDRIVATSCLFPLTEKENLNKSMGTRHRAALGLSEQSDAVIIIVSEETRKISVANNGELISAPTEEKLVELLKELLMSSPNKKVQHAPMV